MCFAPHRIEELFIIVSHVVSSPAGFTVKLDVTFITSVTLEYSLLDTAFVAIKAFIASAIVAAFWKYFFCAKALFNGIFDSFVIIS